MSQRGVSITGHQSVMSHRSPCKRGIRVCMALKINRKLDNNILTNECKYMKHIFELRMKDQLEERSSQLLRNLSSCEKKA